METLNKINYFYNQEPNNVMSPLFVCYLPGSGGGFLMNCLAFNDKVVFANRPLALQQINNEFSTENKLQYVLSQLDMIVDHNMWKDLGLGIAQLGLDKFCDKLGIVEELQKNGLSFALPFHEQEGALIYKKKFPNAKIIGLINSRIFISKFRPARLIDFANHTEILNLWTQLRATDWPELPPAYLENLEQPPFCHLAISDKIKNLLPSLQEVERYYSIKDQEASEYADWTWDASWFLDEHSFLDNLQKLYHAMDLGQSDRDKISCYYSAWIRVLSTFVT
jgi:hypothetical protein